MWLKTIAAESILFALKAERKYVVKPLKVVDGAAYPHASGKLTQFCFHGRPAYWTPAQLCSCLPEMMKDREWFRITLPYMLSIFYTDANNFGLLPSLMPLALANATTSIERQMNLLQICFQVGAFALVCADTLTFYIDIPLRYPLSGLFDSQLIYLLLR